MKLKPATSGKRKPFNYKWHLKRGRRVTADCELEGSGRIVQVTVTEPYGTEFVIVRFPNGVHDIVPIERVKFHQLPYC